jgi:Large eukaryotic DNA virus major capsid protein/Major capsid protein N-terminus
MPGGLINIVSYGADDLYLTGAPQITMFKIVYRRHTNFSKESIVIPLGGIDFDKEVEIQILNTGDLLSNTFLQLEIPEMHIQKIDTAADLTEQEMDILETPYPIKIPEGQPNYVEDYALVKRFMEVNMTGYRKAEKDATIKNQTVIQYITSILNTIQAAAVEPEIIQNYNITLTNALNYELNNLQNNKTKTETLTEQYNAAVAQASDPNEIEELTDQYNKSIAAINVQNRMIYKFISALDFKFSNIDYILRTLLDNLTQNTGLIIYGFVDVSAITINNVLTIIRAAVEVSKKVMNYYFENVKIINIKETDAASKYAKFAWVKRLGYAIIDYVEVRIGGEIIDKHYGEWMNIWHELTTSEDQTVLHNKMVGNVRELTSYDRNAKSSYTLYIPLQFWFCRKHGLAFPMIALQYNKFYISIRLKKLEDCAYIEKLPTVDQQGNDVDFTDNALQLTDIWNNLNFNITGNLLVDFVYLETQERKRFARSAHEYLIETVETERLQNLTDTRQVHELNFTGLSKEFFWASQKIAYINNLNSNYESLWFNYSIDKEATQNPINNTRLMFSGYDRFDKAQRDYAQYYFNLVQPYAHHTKVPSYGINAFTYSLFPEEHQPSGVCNFTRIRFPTLSFDINPNMFKYKLSDIDPDVTIENDQTLETDINVSIYSLKYQVLRVINGMAAFAFY